MNPTFRPSRVASVLLEGPSNCSTGRIKLFDGAVFEGEIVQRSPQGQGKLSLPEGPFTSFYEGTFDGFELSEGRYVNFSETIFTGKFNRNRFYKGEVAFPDGDVLKGEWGAERGMWVLKKGELRDQFGDLVGGLDAGCERVASKGKTVERGGGAMGFAVTWGVFKTKNLVELRNFVLTAEGTWGFERAENFNRVRYKKLGRSVVGGFKKEPLGRGKGEVHWMVLDNGMSVEVNEQSDVCVARFEKMSNVVVRGMYENSNNFFKIKGVLKIMNREEGRVKISQSWDKEFKITWKKEAKSHQAKERSKDLQKKSDENSKKTFSNFSDFFREMEKLTQTKSNLSPEMRIIESKAKEEGPKKSSMSTGVLKMILGVMAIKDVKNDKAEASTELSD